MPDVNVDGFEGVHSGDVVGEVERIDPTIQQHAIHFVDDDAIESAVPADVFPVKSVKEVVALEIGQLSVDDLAVVRFGAAVLILSAVVPNGHTKRFVNVVNALLPFSLAGGRVSDGQAAVAGDDVDFKARQGPSNGQAGHDERLALAGGHLCESCVLAGEDRHDGHPLSVAQPESVDLLHSKIKHDEESGCLFGQLQLDLYGPLFHFVKRFRDRYWAGYVPGGCGRGSPSRGNLGYAKHIHFR